MKKNKTKQKKTTKKTMNKQTVVHFSHNGQIDHVNIYSIKAPITTIVICYVVCRYFKSHCCKQCGPRSDCSCRSSLILVHTVCLYAKCKFEKFARRCSRGHKTTFSDAVFLGTLRVKVNRYTSRGWGMSDSVRIGLAESLTPTFLPWELFF